MPSFKKGLSKDVVTALKNEYEKRAFWYDVVNDPDLFIGIRDNYLNVYFMGNSLLKIQLEAGQLQSYTHYKYLLKNKIEDPYVGFDLGGEVDFGDQSFMETSPSITNLKNASRPYVGVEKKGVHNIVKANINVIDVEVALTQEQKDRVRNPKKEKPTAPRIDFASFIETQNKGLELQFFEAKHFSYGTVLRARGGNEPEVLGQLSDYQVLIDKYREEITSSYRSVCCNLVEILPATRVCPRAKAISEGAPFTVSNLPRLVIFGFDSDQSNGKNWKPHLEKLKELLPGRVLARGNSSDFVKGIG